MKVTAVQYYLVPPHPYYTQEQQMGLPKKNTHKKERSYCLNYKELPLVTFFLSV